jgi:hypothetical protein
MNNNACPKIEKCPIFQENVFSVENAAIAYKSLFCLAGEIKFKSCKRFIVSNKVGSCPSNIMPNSSKSIEEIIEIVKKKG